MITCSYFSKKFGKVEFVQLIPCGVWTFSNTGYETKYPAIVSCHCYKSLKNAMAAYLMGYEYNKNYCKGRLNQSV